MIQKVRSEGGRVWRGKVIAFWYGVWLHDINATMYLGAPWCPADRTELQFAENSDPSVLRQRRCSNFRGLFHSSPDDGSTWKESPVHIIVFFSHWAPLLSHMVPWIPDATPLNPLSSRPSQSLAELASGKDRCRFPAHPVRSLWRRFLAWQEGRRLLAIGRLWARWARWACVISHPATKEIVWFM